MLIVEEEDEEEPAAQREEVTVLADPPSNLEMDCRLLICIDGLKKARGTFERGHQTRSKTPFGQLEKSLIDVLRVNKMQRSFLDAHMQEKIGFSDARSCCNFTISGKPLRFGKVLLLPNFEVLSAKTDLANFFFHFCD